MSLALMTEIAWKAYKRIKATVAPPKAKRLVRQTDPKAMRPFSQGLTGKTIENYVQVREGLQTNEHMAGDLGLELSQIQAIIERIKKNR